MGNSVQNRQSQHSFAQVPKAEIPRSSFDRSHGCKTTFDAGDLIPVYVDEALPGDTRNLSMTAFARLSTPIRPFMDNLYLDSFFFAVPIRLIWNNWERFNGEQANPADSISYIIPTMTTPVGGHLVGSLSDYLGLPTQKHPITHASLWHRAYNLIWNEWFRDQNLQNSVVVDLGDGPDTSTNYTILKRGKRHDYFTSALPWLQKGGASVTIPLGTRANVSGLGLAIGQATGTANGTFKDATTSAAGVVYPWSGTNVLNVRGTLSTTSTVPDIYADLTTATAATINQLRQSFQIQKLLERDARGGTRYTEIVRSHFGVTSSDARLDRPEYLGGGSTPININPVVQTSAAASQPTPLATLSGMGTAHAHGHGFTKSFEEHCVVIGLVSVRADLSYQQGLNRMFSRSTRYDFYWPALSNIGEQAVLNKEIYANADANDNLVFGYQERYAEYRYKPSVITGKFRSTFAQTLDVWHLAQNFTTLPALNSTFIVENPPITRVLAVTTEPHILFDSFFKIKDARPMPVYGVPGLIDHF